MNIVLYSDKIDEYLKHDEIIDYENETIAQLADTLFQKAANELEFIKLTYEFVRDNISHSADINEDLITCSTSEVLKAGHGICFANMTRTELWNNLPTALEYNTDLEYNYV